MLHVQAYKVLALKKHPDKNKDNPNAGTSPCTVLFVSCLGWAEVSMQGSTCTDALLCALSMQVAVPTYSTPYTVHTSINCNL